MRVAAKQGATPRVAAHGSIRSRCPKDFQKARKYIGKMRSFMSVKKFVRPMHAWRDTNVYLPLVEDGALSISRMPTPHEDIVHSSAVHNY